MQKTRVHDDVFVIELISIYNVEVVRIKLNILKYEW